MEFHIHKKLPIHSETPWDECFSGLIENPVFSLVWQEEESRTTDFGLGLMMGGVFWGFLILDSQKYSEGRVWRTAPLNFCWICSSNVELVSLNYVELVSFDEQIQHKVTLYEKDWWRFSHTFLAIEYQLKFDFGHFGNGSIKFFCLKLRNINFNQTWAIWVNAVQASYDRRFKKNWINCKFCLSTVILINLCYSFSSHNCRYIKKGILLPNYSIWPNESRSANHCLTSWWASPLVCWVAQLVQVLRPNLK